MLNNLDFDLTITLAFVVVMLISFFTIVLIDRSTEPDQRKNWLENLWENLWNFRTTLTALSVFLLFFNFHLWFIKLMIQNNIKTNKVSSIMNNFLLNNDKMI